MRADHDGMMLVRAELCDRLDALQQGGGADRGPRFRAADRRAQDDGGRLRPDPGRLHRRSARARARRRAAALPGRPLFRSAARRDRLRRRGRGRGRGQRSPARLDLDPPPRLTGPPGGRTPHCFSRRAPRRLGRQDPAPCRDALGQERQARANPRRPSSSHCSPATRSQLMPGSGSPPASPSAR